MPEGSEAQLKQWFLTSKQRFTHDADRGLPIHKAVNYELFTGAVPPPTYFYDVLDNFDAGPDDRLPSGFSHRYKFDTMLIDPAEYMPHLAQKFVAHGGTLVRKRFTSLDDVMALPERTIFNCLGLGSRQVFNDTSVYPVKGVSFSLPPIPSLRAAVGHNDIFIAPRNKNTYVGAPFIPNWDSDSLTDGEQDYVFDTLREIMEAPGTPFSLPRGTLFPGLIQRTFVGFRPMRDAGPRVEKEYVGDKTIVHNYGHGGNGVILSWGTAAHAVSLLGQISPIYSTF
jgi:glycine/D-amino acid oxidase-like deaminating enzyme